MTERVFLDTNLLVYYYSEDESEKSAIIGNIIKSNDIVISAQIINEFSYVMIRKFGKGPELIREIIEAWGKEFDLKDLTSALSIESLNIHKRYGFSFWDSLVIAAALENNCGILFTEDLHHNQIINEKLIVVNPFEGIPGDFVEDEQEESS
jgi:predicted nucleic acid-binding protein